MDTSRPQSAYRTFWHVKEKRTAENSGIVSTEKGESEQIDQAHGRLNEDLKTIENARKILSAIELLPAKFLKSVTVNSRKILGGSGILYKICLPKWLFLYGKLHINLKRECKILRPFNVCNYWTTIDNFSQLSMFVQ